MTATKLQQIIEQMKMEEKDYNFDVISNLQDDILANHEELETVEDVCDFLQTKMDENDELLREEIIYFGSAMDYLKENDPSLQESLELASNMGYETKNLNSELLASILATENNKDDRQEFLKVCKQTIGE